MTQQDRAAELCSLAWSFRILAGDLKDAFKEPHPHESDWGQLPPHIREEVLPDFDGSPDTARQILNHMLDETHQSKARVMKLASSTALARSALAALNGIQEELSDLDVPVRVALANRRKKLAVQIVRDAVDTAADEYASEINRLANELMAEAEIQVAGIQLGRVVADGPTDDGKFAYANEKYDIQPHAHEMLEVLWPDANILEDDAMRQAWGKEDSRYSLDGALNEIKNVFVKARMSFRYGRKRGLIVKKPMEKLSKK